MPIWANVMGTTKKVPTKKSQRKKSHWKKSQRKKSHLYPEEKSPTTKKVPLFLEFKKYFKIWLKLLKVIELEAPDEDKTYPILT